MTETSKQASAWERHSSDDCPYDDENACIDAWAAAHREQLDRFTEEGLADLNAELPGGSHTPAPSESTVDGRR